MKFKNAIKLSLLTAAILITIGYVVNGVTGLIIMIGIWTVLHTVVGLYLINKKYIKWIFMNR